MGVKQIEISNIGPFLGATTLALAPKITVITGRNDVGKSWVLRALELFSSGAGVTETQVNGVYAVESHDWTRDASVAITLRLQLEQQMTVATVGGQVSLNAGTSIEFIHRAAPQLKSYTFRHKKEVAINGRPPFEIRSLNLAERLDTSLRIESTTPESLTRRVFDHAFGTTNGDFLKKLQGFENTYLRDATLDAANTKLEQLTSAIGLPNQHLAVAWDQGAVRFDVVELGSRPNPLILRSPGFQKSVALEIAFALEAQRPTRVLLHADEPEVSLHANAQHSLRKKLERLCELTGVQMIYVTHSPSMINAARPQDVRVLERLGVDRATGRHVHTVVRDDAVADNFARVRSSLGISAADSLLYAPICVIVEGDTELVCVRDVLTRMCERGSGDLENLLSLVHFLNGQGSPKLFDWCRFARSQGEHPIAFADGDQLKQLRKRHEREPELYDLVHLEEGQEFEDLVDLRHYFACLESYNEAKFDLSDFQAWRATSEIRATSKAIEAWLRGKHPEVRYSKPGVMAAAVEADPDLTHWNLAPFEELLRRIRQIAASF